PGPRRVVDPRRDADPGRDAGGRPPGTGRSPDRRGGPASHTLTEDRVNHLDVALASRSFTAGRAVRSCTVRHRRLVPRPLAVVLWQLGAEPFSAAAIGWGETHVGLRMAVAGEPRNRDLAFVALLEFAKWFNPRFEAFAT